MYVLYTNKFCCPLLPLALLSLTYFALMSIAKIHAPEGFCVGWTLLDHQVVLFSQGGHPCPE